MTIEEIVFTACGPLFAGRVYPSGAEYGTVRPYCIYHVIGGESVDLLDDAEAPDLANQLVQVDVWGDSAIGASQLIFAVEKALRGSANVQSAKPVSAPRAVSEVDLGLYGKQQDFSVWFSRS
jgi:hypothetical protein